MRPYDLVYHQFACNTTCIPPVHQFHLSRFGIRRSGKSMISIDFGDIWCNYRRHREQIERSRSKTMHITLFRTTLKYLCTVLKSFLHPYDPVSLVNPVRWAVPVFSRFGSRRSGKSKISMILVGFQPRIFDEKSKQNMQKHTKT